jgi:transcriptional regulator with XRE-family HTH domain
MTDAPWLAKRYAREYQGKYRHQIVAGRGNLYRIVRDNLRISQKAMADRLGLQRLAYRYRERQKVMYYPVEIAMLHDISGLSAEEFMKLLYDIA